MRELSLFTGIGGGLLGTHGLLGWRTVGAVEWEEYPCKVLAQRQEDGILDDFPIWHMDIGEFNRRIAPAYTGMVDVISAGFPCQPFSLAGKQQGADDERNQWPATIAAIRIIRPRFCFLENVPGLISSGYLGTIFGDLAACGYDAKWRVLSAAELGAPHKRDRLWIVADAKGQPQRAGLRKGEPGRQRRRRPGDGGRAFQSCADGVGTRLEGKQQAGSASRTIDRSSYGSYSGWWTIEPALGRVAHGVPNRVDRLKALGNGQVPAVAAAAWLLLTGAE